MPLKKKEDKSGGRIIRGRKAPSIKQGRTPKRILKKYAISTKRAKRKDIKTPKFCIRLKRKK